MPVWSGNYYLTQSQMEDNASYMYYKFKEDGWTDNAISAMFGNIQTESGLNPGIWEDLKEGNLNKGYGLTQWSPATRIITWLSDNGYPMGSMDGEIARIIAEKNNQEEQWYDTPAYPISFLEFSLSNEDIEYLTKAFVYNYERAKKPDIATRVQRANNWYEYLTGLPPTPPTPTYRKMPWIYYIGNAKRRVLRKNGFIR